MINSADIQRCYNDLYSAMRRYIWNYNTVESLATLEVSVYLRCPDIYDIRNNFYKLKSIVRSSAVSDKKLDESFDKFEEMINSDDSVYCMIKGLDEVVQ